MPSHKNARSTPASREEMVLLVIEQGHSLRAVGERFGISAHTVGKWVRRYREEGATGLLDRSCRPHHRPQSIAPETAERIVELRREGRTFRDITRLCGVSPPTVARVLRRQGLARSD